MNAEHSNLPWDVPPAHVFQVQVGSADIDGLNHCNNVSYLRWLEQAAWEHSIALGLDLAAYQRLDRAMVVRRHELDYLGAAYLNDGLIVGTWLAENDGKLNLHRRYQIFRAADGALLIRARTHFVCIQLSTGRPKRMPAEFSQGYRMSGLH